jgi:hypothetical protein
MAKRVIKQMRQRHPKNKLDVIWFKLSTICSYQVRISVLIPTVESSNDELWELF